MLSDLEIVEARIARLSKIARTDPKARPELELLEELKAHLYDGKPVRTFPKHDEEALQMALNEGRYLSDKKVVYVANVSEDAITEDNEFVIGDIGVAVKINRLGSHTHTVNSKTHFLQGFFRVEMFFLSVIIQKLIFTKSIKIFHHRIIC